MTLTDLRDPVGAIAAPDAARRAPGENRLLRAGGRFLSFAVGVFLLLGSVFLSTPAALISYYVTLSFLKTRSRNRALQEDAD